MDVRNERTQPAEDPQSTRNTSCPGDGQILRRKEGKKASISFMTWRNRTERVWRKRSLGSWHPLGLQPVLKRSIIID